MKTEEVTRYMENRRLRQLVHRQDVELKTDSRDLTITRILGHKLRMPGSGRWRIQTVSESENCWVCDNWVYTIFFWNEEIGTFRDKN